MLSETDSKLLDGFQLFGPSREVRLRTPTVLASQKPETGLILAATKPFINCHIAGAKEETTAGS
ncbi:hypothetical protein SAMN05877838_3951 [Hoeflea halophila]|uniref:Uncharacterized protein n=1 Tax=Hoeflea halophila TaxID=714899 RepID=A0A286IG15_9HYPH|nr:hypothetical protein [Hoeflea halophila]SOE19001.1 hypothetical protein SAMN05877838_3951 [Hoeflea halophila]